MELSYALPYGSLKDLLYYAGFVASNVLRGDVNICHTERMIDPREDQLILDVRKPFEVAAGMIPGAIHIPLDELRDRIGELPNEKEILAYCQVGLRGYLACRILTQKGYKCRNYSGGIKTYTAVTGKAPRNPEPPKAEACDESGTSCETGQGGSRRAAAVVKHVDACGLQCLGPIMQVAEALAGIKEGEAITVLASDPAFTADVDAWCHSTGNRFLAVVP